MAYVDSSPKSEHSEMSFLLILEVWMTTAIRRKYAAQTKIDAVGQVIKAGLPLRQVARSYDMPEQTLENWL